MSCGSGTSSWAKRDARGHQNLGARDFVKNSWGAWGGRVCHDQPVCRWALTMLDRQRTKMTYSSSERFAPLCLCGDLVISRTARQLFFGSHAFAWSCDDVRERATTYETIKFLELHLFVCIRGNSRSRVPKQRCCRWPIAATENTAYTDQSESRSKEGNWPIATQLGRVIGREAQREVAAQ